MRDINQYSITQAVKDSFQTEPGSRFETLLHGLIDHLHDFTREVNLTQEEWIGVLNFLYDCGQISTPERHEFILLSDVLGFSALVDMINTRGGATEGLEPRPILPRRRARDETRRATSPMAATASRCSCTARVTDTLHKPLAGAIVDTWQADASGTYPIQEQEQGQDKYDLRGKFTTDEQGRYWYTTVLPKPYTVPYDGPVGRAPARRRPPCMAGGAPALHRPRAGHARHHHRGLLREYRVHRQRRGLRRAQVADRQGRAGEEGRRARLRARPRSRTRCSSSTSSSRPRADGRGPGEAGGIRRGAGAWHRHPRELRRRTSRNDPLRRRTPLRHVARGDAARTADALRARLCRASATSGFISSPRS